MKISCDVIKDLLALYVDKVLSPDSTALVDAHLLECADCRAELNSMAQDAKIALPPEQDITAKQALGVLSRGIKKVMRWRVIAAVLLTAAVIGLLFWCNVHFIQESNKLVDPALIDTQVRLLKNGRLIFGTKRNDGEPLWQTWGSSSSHDWEHPEICIQFYEPIWRVHKGEAAYMPGTMEDGYIYNDLFGTNLRDGILFEYGQPSRPLSKISIGEFTSADRKVIWSEGDDIRPASEQLEKAFELQGYTDLNTDWIDDDGDDYGSISASSVSIPALTPPRP